MKTNGKVSASEMWKIEYTDSDGKRVLHVEKFHTRKAARMCCKRLDKEDMYLYGPNGEGELYQRGDYESSP